MTFNPSQYRVPAGQGGGGRWGSPRDSKAATAQKDVGAQRHAAAVAKLPKGKAQSDYVKKLSDGDLEKLTAILYSSRTSDPAIVHARILVANEMTKRGIDIKKFGALGGGLHAGSGKTGVAPTHHTRAHHRKKPTLSQTSAALRIHKRQAAAAKKKATAAHSAGRATPAL